MSSQGFHSDVAAARSHSAYRVLPSHIHANHQDNAARAPIYSLATELPELAAHPAIEGDLICFSASEVETRLASFLRDGQRTPIKVHRSNTGVPSVAEGFLRHLAGLLAEVRGTFDTIPGVKQVKALGLRCDAEAQPTTPEDRVAAAFANQAENETLTPTPIDTAWLVKRLLAMNVARADIAVRLNMSERNILRLLELLTLPISQQMAIREGRLAMTAALAKASERGTGSATGKRANLSVKKMRVAVANRGSAPPPTVVLEPDHAVMLIAMIAGETYDADAVPEAVVAWAEWMQPARTKREPKPPREKKAREPKAERAPKPRKQAAPKPGKEMADKLAESKPVPAANDSTVAEAVAS